MRHRVLLPMLLLVVVACSGEIATPGGMIRPVDVTRGRIDHAIRVAIGYPHPARWFWPATKTETWGTSADDWCPMGARVFLDPSVDVDAVAAAAEAALADPKNRAFARLLVVAIREFGLIPLDGGPAGHNVYMEGDATAGWDALIGPKNAYGSYNDIARAVRDALPWDQLRVADESVFNDYGRQ